MEIDYIEDVHGKVWRSAKPFEETGFKDENFPKYYPVCIIKRQEKGNFLIEYFDENKFGSENLHLLNSNKRFEHWVKPNAKVILYPNGIRMIKLK